jgi:AraC-like DNA-binding protein
LRNPSGSGACPSPELRAPGRIEATRRQAVAASVGFYDQARFSRHFKRVVGTSPRRYAGTGAAAYRRSSAPRTNAA